MLLVDTAALAALAYELVTGTDAAVNRLPALFALIAGAAASAEVFRRTGTLYRGRDRGFHNLLSVFLLGGALILPPLWATVLPLPVYALFRLRTLGRKLTAAKVVFNTSMYVVVCTAASHVRLVLAPGGAAHNASIASFNSSSSAWGSALIATAVFVVLNMALVINCLRRVTPSTPLRAVVGDRNFWALAAVDASAGIVVAVSWAVSPVFYVVALGPVMFLQRSLIYRHLAKAARTDAKTGLSTPSHWRWVAERVVARTQRTGGSLAVIMVDLDHFKSVNDTHGHLVGDSAVVAAAETLRLAVRPLDVVGRFGGDEFIVLLIGADREAAAVAAGRLCEDIAALKVSAHGCPLPLTASAGVAVYGEHGIALDEIIAAADAALYRAKRAGRNRVCMAAPGEADRWSDRLPAPPAAGSAT